ncbi:hypothetical protein [Chitinophaga caseinilytica]|uniref:Uncharacterized protein n=1 Tax=Chitinophaga caseinilytica TaxID=2267521 RepID=A0ABZ2YY75_9BACT
MRVLLTLLTGAVLMLACQSKRQRAEKMRELSLLDEKEASGWKMRLRYLPENGKDTSAWNLVLRVEHASGLPQKMLNDPKFSFGIDSLFEVITPADTVSPFMAIRVANGQTNGAEYMITFDRSALRHSTGVQLRFRDWLFSQRDLYFPLNVTSIHQLDSIYTRI